MKEPERNRVKMHGLAQEFANHGVSTPAPEDVPFTVKIAYGGNEIYHKARPERYACAAVIIDKITDRIVEDGHFADNINPYLTPPRGPLQTRAGIFLVVLEKLEVKIITETEAELQELERASASQEEPTPELQAYMRLRHWEKFYENNLRKDKRTSLDDSIETGLGAGFSTAISTCVGIMDIVHKLCKENPALNNPESMAETFHNSFPTILRLAAMDLDLMSKVFSVVEDYSGGFKKDQFQLEPYAKGYKIDIKEGVEAQARMSPNLNTDRVENPTGCPALAKPNGKMPIMKLFDFMDTLAKPIYSYTFEPKTDDEQEYEYIIDFIDEMEKESN